MILMSVLYLAGGSGAAATIADPPRAAEPNAESVLVGLKITQVDEINDAAKTFRAEFELSLRSREEFNPTELRFADATKPIPLDHPDEATDQVGEHSRLFHLSSTLR